MSNTCVISAKLAVLLFLAPLVSCIPRTVVPLRTVAYEQTPRNEGLIVYLPGRGDSINVLQGNGIIDSIRVYAPSFDVVVADAHIGYYADRSLHKRITEDIIAPAKARGYRHIWFLGNSMGGLGSQLYAWKQPGTIEGMILMGPFIPANSRVKEITRAGGLAKWSMPARVNETDWERHLWQWHKECINGDTGCPQVYITYGVNDLSAPGIRLLEQALPQGHVLPLDGGHDWPVWKEGLLRFLRAGVLQY
jgi:pimeloyl-ACP methyl ester carboxylesterase